MKTILVKAAEPRKAFWERHEAHPGGEVFVHGPHAAEVAETAAVRAALREGRLVAIGGAMPQIFRYKGETYTVETLQDAPAEFLMQLARDGLLPAGFIMPAEVPVPSPADGTVAEVLSAIRRGRVSATQVLEAERAGKNRVTLIAALESLLEEAPPAEEEE